MRDNILFQTDMLQAILNVREGTWPVEILDRDMFAKWQTRRLFRVQPVQDNLNVLTRDGEQSAWVYRPTEKRTWYAWQRWDYQFSPDVVNECPYADRLWVRETWRVNPHDRCRIDYKAGGSKILTDTADNMAGKFLVNRWRPSIHMFKWASRMDIVVREVTAERVHGITPFDAEAEGVSGDHSVEKFADLWNSIHGKMKRVKRNPYTGEREDCWVAFPFQDERQQETLKSGLVAYTVGNPWVWALKFSIEYKGVLAWE